MQAHTSGNRTLPLPRFWLGIAAVLITILLLALPVSAQETPLPPTPVPSSAAVTAADEALVNANNAVDRADLALNEIDRILAIIQVAGIIVAIATAAVAIAGYRSNRELNEELKNMRGLRDQMEQALTDINNSRDEQIKAANDDNQRLRTEIDKTLAEIRASRDELATNVNKVDDYISNAFEASAMSQLAQRQIALNNLKAATKIFQDACELDPENRIYQYFLGDLLVRQGRFKDGIRHLRSAREANYKYPSADASYAYALRLQGDEEDDAYERERLYAESNEIFLGVFKVDPDLVDISGESVFGALAGLYRRQGRYEKALEWYHHCRKVTPSNSYPINNLALLNFQMGNQTEADKYFKRAIEIVNEKLALRSSDYWARFDRITAKAAILDSPETLTSDLEKIGDVATGPLKKFMYGLEQLREAKNPPPGVMDMIDRIITQVKTEIAARENPG